ncbi:hypothetical protein [Alteromonas sediminis]|uniref:hypothetical protein n=1 Tax=Alteromonas sediminis TaxID=2259342 RepID=UPI0014049330|nr:hypothetical protein [Alteromonas sediminis]
MNAISLLLVMGLPVVFFAMSAVAVAFTAKWLNTEGNQLSQHRASMYPRHSWATAQFK